MMNYPFQEPHQRLGLMLVWAWAEYCFWRLLITSSLHLFLFNKHLFNIQLFFSSLLFSSLLFSSLLFSSLLFSSLLFSSLLFSSLLFSSVSSLEVCMCVRLFELWLWYLQSNLSLIWGRGRCVSGQVCPSTQHTALDSPSHSTTLDACCSEEPDLTHTFGACECVVENRGNE